MAASGETKRRGPWKIVFRVALLLVGGLSLYLLAPKLLAMWTSWPELKTTNPLWIGLAVLFEAMSYVGLWEVQRIALRNPSWFAVGTSQLASSAAGSVIPGGGATSGAIAYRMLVQAGIRAGDVAAGLAASTLATTATVLALPLLSLPALLGGIAAPHRLIAAGWLGIAGFVAVSIVAAVGFSWDKPLVLVGRAAVWCLQRLRRSRAGENLPARLLEQRDRLLRTFGHRWYLALGGSVGKVGFDFLALLCCLAAVGARPHPSLVLLAYVAGALLALIPVTPGGLGFVEAGLTGMLTLAGVGGEQAVVATLAYRLVSFWLPLPIGGVAYLLFRRRYDSTPASITSP
jgi:uncharacterized protein (TIRG00374 family)